MLKQLHEVMSDGVTLNLTVMKIGDKLTVMVLPKTKVDDAYKNLPPFSATGSPEEVEKDLIETISKPIQDLGTTVVGLEEFNKNKAAADKENAAAKAKKDAEKKEKEAADKKDKKADSKKPDTKKTKKVVPKAAADTSGEDEEEEQNEAAAEAKAPEDPNVTQLNKFLAEGKVAVSAGRAISAKSIRAKVNALVETMGGVEGELKEEVATFAESVAKLTGELV